MVSRSTAARAPMEVGRSAPAMASRSPWASHQAGLVTRCQTGQYPGEPAGGEVRLTGSASPRVCPRAAAPTPETIAGTSPHARQTRMNPRRSRTTLPLGITLRHRPPYPPTHEWSTATEKPIPPPETSERHLGDHLNCREDGGGALPDPPENDLGTASAGARTSDSPVAAATLPNRGEVEIFSPPVDRQHRARLLRIFRHRQILGGQRTSQGARAPRGLFASGKFDQYKRDIPYATLAQAIQGLIRPLLGKSEAELAGWRDALREALDPNAELMVDLVPELKLVIGEQPPVPELPPQDAQRRFQLVFRRFLGVFARPDHPLALFLDDLQWLDPATLDLLEDLLTQSEVRHLLLIGAYRDNEVVAAIR